MKKGQSHIFHRKLRHDYFLPGYQHMKNKWDFVKFQKKQKKHKFDVV